MHLKNTYDYESVTLPHKQRAAQEAPELAVSCMIAFPHEQGCLLSFCTCGYLNLNAMMPS